MKKMFLIFFVCIFLISLSAPVYAWRWCCSYHGGQAYCNNGRWVCKDGTYSPTCTCGWGYSYISYCPKNSTSNGIGWCICNIWYVSSSDLKSCMKDPNITCNEKYPGTYFSNTENACICPGINIWRRDKKTKSCPPEYEEYCKWEYWEFSYYAWGEMCGCLEGYIMQDHYCIKDVYYEERQQLWKDIDEYNDLVMKNRISLNFEENPDSISYFEEHFDEISLDIQRMDELILSINEKEEFFEKELNITWDSLNVVDSNTSSIRSVFIVICIVLAGILLNKFSKRKL